MGGMGSGRHGGRVTIEGCGSLTIDVATLFRGVRVPPSRHLTGYKRMTWSRDGEPWAIADLDVSINSEGAGWMRLRYDIEHYSRSTGPQDRRIDLIGLPRKFGGFMWYAWCPLGGGLARKLYLPNGAAMFASRSAYRLRYAVQNEGALDRAHRRLAKTYRRLGDDYGGIDSVRPAKPRWMRQRTYDRLCQRIERDEDALDWAFAPRLVRLLQKFGPGL